jgi:hypothetical protein
MMSAAPDEFVRLPVGVDLVNDDRTIVRPEARRDVCVLPPSPSRSTTCTASSYDSRSGNLGSRAVYVFVDSMIT